MLALHALHAAAVILAWGCVRRVPAYRPVAFTLSVALAAELASEALIAWALPIPAPSQEIAPPYEGILRWAVYIDGALFIAWPAALAACALRVLAERREWPVALAYTAVSVALAASYPEVRGAALRRWYLGVDITASLIGLASLITWLRRHWGTKRPDLAVTVTAVLVAAHFTTIIAGPYRFGLFGPEWYLAQLAYLLMFCLVILLEAAALRSPPA